MAAVCSSVVQGGCACFTSAATPATCGVAIDVPDSNNPWLPVPTAAEKTATPGAVTLGFSAESTCRGPPELKLATTWKPGFARIVGERTADVAAASAPPSVEGAPCTPRKGTATLGM